MILSVLIAHFPIFFGKIDLIEIGSNENDR